MSFSAGMLICQRAGRSDKSVSQESVHKRLLYIFYSRNSQQNGDDFSNVCMWGKLYSASKEKSMSLHLPFIAKLYCLIPHPLQFVLLLCSIMIYENAV